MRPWPSVPLGDMVAPVTSWTPQQDDPSASLTYIDLRAVDQDSKAITGTRVLLCEEAPSRARQIVCSGDILVATVRPNLNAVARVPLELDGATASKGFCVLRPRATKLDNGYLFHWVRSPRFVGEMIRRATGASYPAVSDRIVVESKLPTPPLVEQRRIAEILDKADALRAKRRAALAQLDTLTQSIFLDMFGDPRSNPKRWPEMQFGDLLSDAEVFVDGDWVESKDQDPTGEVRLIQLADIGDGTYIDKSSRFLNKQTAARLKCTMLKSGDVPVARMPDPLGRACIFPGDAKESVTVVDVCVIRPSSAGPETVWLMCCINSEGFRQRIAREATGTTRERISRGNLSRLRIFAPPIRFQRAFAHQVAAVAKLRTAHRTSLIELDTLFASLQYRAFRGEL